MDDYFSVGTGAEDMAFRQKSIAEFLEVVDLAIEDDPDGFILVGHGLRTRAQVDDGQTAMAEADGTTKVHALPIRPPMGDGLEHGANQGLSDPGTGVKDQFTSDATHRWLLAARPCASENSA